VNDYRYNFPTSGLALALDGMAALRTELGLDDTALPANALGDRRDASGAVVVTPLVGALPVIVDAAVWVGRPGSAATSFEGPDGKVVEIPAKGDPARYYMHIRTDQTAPGFDPAAYGMTPTDPAESAAVLGVWAGDEVTT